MRLADAHGSLLRLRQEWSRKLFMGSGCACHHARLRGDDDAVCPLHLLCGRLRAGRHIRAPDLYQMEHGRGRHREIHPDAVRGVHVHHRRLHRIPGLFRLPHIEKRFRISMIVITKSNENEEVKECNEKNRRRSIVQGCDARHSVGVGACRTDGAEHRRRLHGRNQRPDHRGGGNRQVCTHHGEAVLCHRRSRGHRGRHQRLYRDEQRRAGCQEENHDGRGRLHLPDCGGTGTSAVFRYRRLKRRRDERQGRTLSGLPVVQGASAAS